MEAYPEPYSNLGNLFLRQGKRAEVVEQYRRALALSPRRPRSTSIWRRPLPTKDRATRRPHRRPRQLGSGRISRPLSQAGLLR